MSLLGWMWIVTKSSVVVSHLTGRAYDDERGSLKALGFGDPLKQPRPEAEMWMCRAPEPHCLQPKLGHSPNMLLV